METWASSATNGVRQLPYLGLFSGQTNDSGNQAIGSLLSNPDLRALLFPNRTLCGREGEEAKSNDGPYAGLTSICSGAQVARLGLP